MIKITDTVLRKQKNFWNGCVFHPTDAVEDPWGRRILDRMAEDGAIRMVRIYTMFEDIVYLGANGEICYDFRLSDLRLDYLVEKGYDLTLAYAGIPDAIAASTKFQTTSAKGKTRYKGKMWNTCPPKDYKLWEELCYEYTKHIVERYGIETVKNWHCHCFNEPDHPPYLLGELGDAEGSTMRRCEEYCRLYEAFERGVRRASEEVQIGGPALAAHMDFLGGWLDYVKEHDLKLDFVTCHYYGTTPKALHEKRDRITAETLIRKQKKFEDCIAAHGFSHIPLVIDEWGMACAGFCDCEKYPEMIVRETEVYSSYFAKLIARYLEENARLDNLLICLSGQHEMTKDFTGFRNFFSLNFIPKPIYNCYVLAAKLGDTLLKAECENKNISIIPTKTEKGYGVLLTYSSEFFEEDLPEVTESVCFADDVGDKTLTVWCIDKETTNPYRLYQRLGLDDPTAEQLQMLRDEGRLKPVKVQKGSEPLSLKLTANCTYFIAAE